MEASNTVRWPSQPDRKYVMVKGVRKRNLAYRDKKSTKHSNRKLPPVTSRDIFSNKEETGSLNVFGNLVHFPENDRVPLDDTCVKYEDGAGPYVNPIWNNRTHPNYTENAELHIKGAKSYVTNCYFQTEGFGCSSHTINNSHWDGVESYWDKINPQRAGITSNNSVIEDAKFLNTLGDINNSRLHGVTIAPGGSKNEDGIRCWNKLNIINSDIDNVHIATRHKGFVDIHNATIVGGGKTIRPGSHKPIGNSSAPHTEINLDTTDIYQDDRDSDNPVMSPEGNPVYTVLKNNTSGECYHITSRGKITLPRDFIRTHNFVSIVE